MSQNPLSWALGLVDQETRQDFPSQLRWKLKELVQIDGIYTYVCVMYLSLQYISYIMDQSIPVPEGNGNNAASSGREWKTERNSL